MSIKFERGEFAIAATEMAELSDLLKRLAGSDDRAFHKAFAQRIFGPIRTKAEYEEVYDTFFVTQPVQPGEMIRIAQADYIATAWYTTPSAQVRYVRPGRKYSAIEWKMIDTGMKFGWDDLAEAGWPMLNFYMSQASEELARKRDAAAVAVIDTSIAAQAGHTVTCYGALTRSAVDSVLRAASDDKFPISFAVIAPSTVMDMANWTAPVNSLWRTPEKYGEQIVQEGHVSNYGGIAWYSKRFAATGSVYFGGVPGDNGMWRFVKGGTRTATDVDIDTKEDRYTWDEKWSYNIEGGAALYKITIS